METDLNQLLGNYYWVFDGDSYTSQAAFENGLRAYSEELELAFPEPSRINLKEIAVLLEYVDEKDEDHEVEFKLSADNDEFFSEIELLYKINNKVTKQLADLDKHFFEGLSLLEATNPPLYSLDLGS